MLRYGCVVGALLLVSACGLGPYKAPKQADYNEATGQLELAQPCPDWSSPSSSNYNNVNHSNFGCATTNNIAQQLDNPEDLVHGHGTVGPDTGMTIHTIEDYRDGKIPTVMQPTQASSGSP